MALTEIQLIYVGFMAPLAKKVPDPWVKPSFTQLYWLLTLHIRHYAYETNCILEWKIQ